MLTSANLFFYIAFLSQIFIISYYYPKKIMARTEYVRKNFPPAQYPLLYPRPAESYAVGHFGFKLANRLIVVLGFGILTAILFWVDHATFADDGFISEAFPAAYGMIQFLPLIALEISEYSQFKLMRAARVATIRTADLRRRGIFDFVSPWLVGLTLLMYLGAIGVDLVAHQFLIRWDHDTVQRTLIFTATNLLMLGVNARHVFGRKLNPHLADADRATLARTSLHTSLYVSMALSVFWMLQAADDVYALDFLDAAIMSLFFQMVVVLSLGHVLRSVRLEDIDFDVYKERPAT